MYFYFFDLSSNQMKNRSETAQQLLFNEGSGSGSEANDESPASCIDFQTVEIGQLVTKFIHVKNMSTIDAHIHMEVDTFRTSSDASIVAARKSTLDPMVASRSSQAASLFSSSLCLTEKKNGLGVGIEHKRFELGAEQTRSVACVLMPQMWGQYVDTLRVNVRGNCDVDERQVRFGVRACVVGLPIKIHTAKVAEEPPKDTKTSDSLLKENGVVEEISMLRFGTHIQSERGTEPIMRKLKIQNTSWLPVSIHWRTYLCDRDEQQQQQQKLVQLNLEYAEDRPEVNDAATSVTSRSNVSLDRAYPDPDMSIKSSSGIKQAPATLEMPPEPADEPGPLIRVNLCPYYGREQDDDDDDDDDGDDQFGGERVFALDTRHTVS